jgi:hypothetical protein
LTEIISTDGTFSEQHKNLLVLLADMMIPANEDYPSAAAPEVFARTLQALSDHEATVVEGLAALEVLAQEKHQGSFATLSDTDRITLIDEFKPQQPLFIQVLQARVVGSYYQDDRVLLALGLPARPPHPGGYDVAATDWTLLDPVRARKPFYRKTDDHS